LIAAFLVLYSAFTLTTVVARRQLASTTRSFGGPVTTLDVHVGSGSVHVTTWTRSGASVTSTVTQGITSPTLTESLVGGRLTIRSSCAINFIGNNACNLDLRVVVPERARLELSSDQGDVSASDVWAPITASSGEGDVTVSGCRATADLSSQQGNVNATGLSGAVVTASSAQGDVTIAFSAVPRRVVASSDQGNVTVELPRGPAAYDVVASSDQGNVNTGGVHVDSSSGRHVTARSSQGDVTVGYVTR
jgi:DUF4097 and DUF4098 domain-containing protein YvlB